MKKPLIQQRDIIFALKTLPQAHGICRASIFGSYAKGTATSESDVDLLVEFDVTEIPDLIEFIGLKQGLQDYLHVSVDLVTPGSLSKYMKNEILLSAKTIYVK